MSTIPHILSETTLTFLVGSTPYQIPREASTFDQVVAELNKPQADETRLVELANAALKVAQEFAAISKLASVQGSTVNQVAPYLAKGTVTVDRHGVQYNGEPLVGALAQRLQDILTAGLRIGPWVRFAENLLMNPAEHAREELYLWLEKADLPITEDGHFLAYKRVKGDYTDCHTGTIDNSIGQVVNMPGGRQAVDPVRDNLCSTGLHFCSKDYLPSFGNSGGNRVVILKINPADVVSIPSDYDNTKGRTWRYEVVDEIDASEIFNKTWAPINYDYDDFEEEDDYLDEDEQDQEYYDEQYAYYSVKDIISLRGLAKGHPRGSRWVYKEARKHELVDFLARKDAGLI